MILTFAIIWFSENAKSSQIESHILKWNLLLADFYFQDSEVEILCILYLLSNLIASYKQNFK